MNKGIVNRHDVGKIALFAAAYFLSHQISFFFPDQAKVIMAIWPAAGVGLAALLLNPRSLWFLIAIVLFLTGNLADFLAGRNFIASSVFMVANILESLGCAWLILRVCGDNVTFNRVKEILALIAAAAFVNAGTAFIGAAAAVFVHGDSFWSFWATWFIADGLGILLITPFIVAWAAYKDPFSRLRWNSAIELGVFLLLWSAISWLSFNTLDILRAIAVKPYMLFILLVWPALRFGQRGVTFALVIFAGIAVTSSSVGTGPLLLGGHNMAGRLLLVQIFLGIIAVTGFILAASYSETRSALRNVAEEKEKLSAVINNSPSLVYLKDLDGRFLLVNQQVAKLFGKSPDELLGKTIYDLIDPKHAKEHDTNDCQVIATGMPLTIEESNNERDGIHTYLTTKFPIRDAVGKVSAVGGISTDITERKQFEDTKKNLIVAVSHSLRTPVVMIEMALDMMKRGIESNDNSRIEKGGSIIYDNVGKLRKDINNMLKVFTLYLRKEAPDEQRQQQASLNKIVENIYKERRLALDEKGLKFEVDIPAADDMVRIDEREVTLILDNLIDNALKFTREGGIIVSCRRKDDLVEIRVKDTGCGIQLEDKDKLFDMFFKHHIAVEGLGLGLFICKGIVDSFGGSIQIESDGPGKGSEILVTLPYIKQTE